MTKRTGAAELRANRPLWRRQRIQVLGIKREGACEKPEAGVKASRDNAPPGGRHEVSVRAGATYKVFGVTGRQ
jgi:hypothetical protein